MSTIMLSAFRMTYSKAIVCRAVYYSSQPEYASKTINKVVNVAIIGAPNSGKSTLINNIVERKICAASNKVHTTTKLVRVMCFQNDTQIIFLDTPGVATEKEQKRYKLPDSMINACHKSLRCADVIGVVHDISNKWTKDNLHTDVLNMLNSAQSIPSFLIINKIDKLESKRQLLSVIRNLTNGMIAGNPVNGPETDSRKKRRERGYSHFSDIFLVSALNGDGVKDIKDYLISNAKPASLHYSPEEWTDQTPESLIEEAVRAKFLDFLAQELPYNLKIELEYYENLDEKIICSVSVECPSDRIARLISGAGGGRLQQIKSQTRNDLVDLFKKPVVISIQLKVKPKL
ncbi:GTPase Era, mitochondrial [Leguminivora glycinivorella]|uniref:GTPase Era, mitochondrial n=1 Tax=Leguminivora glycinivorella TaxID=1035111 RepID=UPI00200D3D76|nr:GTPase Era, mitochondrial [Leguminivora glycinivorella]